MKSRNHQEDASSLIMRNPYESLSASKQSSKFYQPSDQNQIRQFDTINNSQRPVNQNLNVYDQNPDKQMKYMYSFYDPLFKGQNLENNCSQIQTPHQMPKPVQNKKTSHQSFNYAERLTFENQSVSPFIRPQNGNKNIHEQNEFRHSFNPLQNKVNELQKMCKKLYELSLQQNQKYEIQRNSIVRIEHKIDYLLEFFQNQQDSKLSHNLITRSSNDNKKRTSIPHHTNGSKRAKQVDFMNSSQKLSRYLEPPSSEQANFRKLDERSFYNNSKGMQSNRTKKIKPFIVNSDFQNQSSIPELYYNQTMEFNQDDSNKQNVNSSNFIIYEHAKQYKPMIKKQTPFQNLTPQTGQKRKNTYEKAAKQRKSAQKIHEKQVKLSKNKTQQLRKLQNSSNQAQCNKNQLEDNKVIIRQRARSQNTTNRKKMKEENSKRKTYYEVSVTAPNVDYEERQKSRTYNNSKMDQGNMLQTSAIFKAVQFPSASSQNKRMEMKQCLSSQLPRHKRKDIIQNHNKTLLESIEEKKQLIDRELSRRLMKNASLLHGGSTNLLISKDNH